MSIRFFVGMRQKMILTALSRREFGYPKCAKLAEFFVAGVATFATFAPRKAI
jgi:hypothetical protein